MGCDLSKVYNIEIHLENELAVFEPRDEVAGHVLIHAEEDTAIHSCVIWLYGLVKTRWTPGSKAGLAQAGSLSVGLNMVRSTTTLNALSDTRKLESLCTSTLSFFNHITDNIRNVGNEWKKDGLCAQHMKKPCYPDLECSWDMRQSLESRTSTAGSYSRDQITRNTERANSYNSVTDTLIASLEKGSCSRHSSSTSKISCLSADAALASQMKANRFSFLACQSCDSCASQILSQRCTVLNDIDQTKKKKKDITHGDVRIIYRAKVNLLKHFNSPIRQNTRAEAEPSSESSYSNSQDNTGNEGVDSQNEEGSTNDKTNTRNHGSGSAATPDSEVNTLKKATSGTAFLLTRGTHIFDFEFKLPADLPSSFELPTSCLVGGAAARLCYGLRIEIRNYTARIRHTQQREIIVFRPLELTHFPRLRDRVTLHKEFILSGCCASPNGLILCDLTVNKTGFVPGESIIPQIHVINRSPRAIQTVHLTFAQTIVLRGRREQRHVEVLRLFATRLKPRQAIASDNPSNRLTDRSLEENPSLFSPSISPSSHVSPAKSDQSRPAVQTEKTSGSGKTNGEIYRSVTSNLVAVQPHGASAYFEDIIHVPPLPATGLFGRQSLIQVEYMLILRLRMEGDVEGKHEQRMQIPITVGSDPTRETSFIGSNEVVPCYASFNYASGEVIEYDPSSLGPPNQVPRHLRPVYRYFKPRATMTTHTTSAVPQPPTASSRSSLARPEKRVSTGSKSSVVMHDTSDYFRPAVLEQRSRCESQGSLSVAKEFTSRAMSRPRTSLPGRNLTTSAYALPNGNKVTRSTEDDNSSDSPSFPILSKQQFFDNGDRVTLDDEDEPELEEQSPIKIDASEFLPIRSHTMIDRKLPRDPKCNAAHSNRWLHLGSPRRQYSIELYSDHTISGNELESNSENGVAEEDEYLSDEDPLRLTYKHSTSDVSSTSNQEEVATFDSCEEVEQTRFLSPKVSKTYSPKHSPRLGLSPSKSLTTDLGYSYADRKQKFESIISVQDTRDKGLLQSHGFMSEKIDTCRPSAKTLHHAYWNRPKVAPVPGRMVERDQYWTAATIPTNSDQAYCEPVEFSLRSTLKASNSHPVANRLETNDGSLEQ